MQKDEAKLKIQELVEKYEKVKASHSISKYTEEETKKDFIQPLFQALGWNTTDKNEVTAEQVMSAGRIDYGFYLNGRLKFNVEAKSLKTDLNREDYANQAVKYSWNKGATWAILTDFENLKVFNAQVIDRSLSDKQFFDISYDKYIERFDQLWLLSKEAFIENLLDKEAEKVGKKLQIISVGALLYKDLDECRDILTHVLSICNPKVDKDLLDEGVQKLLDRLIFLRVAEDRAIEGPILKELVREHEEKGGHKFQTMIKKFRELDEIYNSNLFSEHPFEKWEEYGDATEKVIKILYGKPGYYEYDFKAMPADVLGGVYENYLGYRLQKSRKGLTVNKDANKRKESGIYYTPDFIVDYIVKNTLKPVLDKCTSIEQLKKIKVLDPACGSGSFLIKALEVIHAKYVEFGSRGDVWTKIDILLNNIYGVDLDPQAVEIARLNLLINALDTKMKLPSLANNIKKGNSLISDKKVSSEAFNWKEEFPEVFKQGGFDIIIENPPYIKEDTNKSVFDGLHTNVYYQGKMDIWTMFGCTAIDLLKDKGMLGLIAPNNWISNYGASIFRNKILNDGEIIDYVDFGDYKVFESASIQTMILIYQKVSPKSTYSFNYLKIKNKNIPYDDLIKELFNKDQGISIDIKPIEFKDKFISFNESDKENVLAKIQSALNFKLESSDVGNGIDVLQDFVTDKHLLKLKDKDIKKGSGILILSDQEIEQIKPTSSEMEYLKPYFTTSQINRYLSENRSNKKIIYADTLFRENINQFPNLKRHIDRFVKVLTSVFAPYGLHRVREKRFFEGEGIFAIRKTKRPAFTYVNFPCYVTRAFLVLKPKGINLKYLTGILNSSVINFWLKNKGKLQGEQLQIDKEPLLSVPIFMGDKEEQATISSLVDKMLKLNLELKKAIENSEKWNSIKIDIGRTDKKINEEVYRLYALTSKEVEMVEAS